MKHLGDYDTNTVIYGKFTTFRPSTGAAYTLAGTPVISVYKDNSTTQTTTGASLTADFDSVTGLNHFTIDTSADGTFYSAGSFFDVVITTGTVDSVSVVGTVVASFTIRKDSSLKPTTAGRTLDVSAGGEAGVDWANVGSPTTSLNLSGTTISTSQAIASVSGAVGSVTGNVGGSVANVTGGINTAAGTITTLDGLDTAQDTQHSTTQSAIATVDTVVDSILVDTTGIRTKMKKNTAHNNFLFTMQSTSDGSGLTGATVSGEVSIDGAAFTSLTNSVSEVSDGWYKINLDAADLNGDNIAIRFTASGAITKDILILTQS